MKSALLLLCAAFALTPALARASDPSLQFSLAAGQAYQAPLAPELTFKLEPTDNGWQIDVAAPTCANLAAITLPLHGVNATQLEGWHFRNTDNTGPNEGSVIAPAEERDFVYALNCADQARIMAAYQCMMTAATDCPEVGALVVGTATLRVEAYTLSPPEKGQMARFLAADFTLTPHPPQPLGQVDGLSAPPLG